MHVTDACERQTVASVIENNLKYYLGTGALFCSLKIKFNVGGYI